MGREIRGTKSKMASIKEAFGNRSIMGRAIGVECAQEEDLTLHILTGGSAAQEL